MGSGLRFAVCAECYSRGSSLSEQSQGRTRFIGSACFAFVASITGESLRDGFFGDIKDRCERLDRAVCAIQLTRKLRRLILIMVGINVTAVLDWS
jgi:hypothetical protein